MSNPEFINIDMELSSSENLSTLADELKGSILILKNEYEGKSYKLNFECKLNERNPTNVLMQYANLLKALSKNSQNLLKKCDSRILDFGYESGKNLVLSNFISAEVLADIASFNFDFVITIYPLVTDRH